MTTEIAPTNPLAPVPYDFAPRSLQEAMELANMLAKSTIVPKDYIDKPGNILVAMQLGAEIGLKPMQAMQSIAVINGRPCLWGDAQLALVLASPLCEYVREEETDEVGIVRVKRVGQPEQVRQFSKADATKAKLLEKDIWKAYTRRMLKLRARAFALRDVFPDVLRGIPQAEELRDIPRDVTAESTVERTSDAPPNSNTRTSALKERLKIVNIADAIAAFNAAQDGEQLQAAVEQAKGLRAEDHKEQANNAYHRARERLRKAQAPSGQTDEAILKMLAVAETVDQVLLVMDLIRPIAETDQVRFELLLAHCRKRESELEQATA